MEQIVRLTSLTEDHHSRARILAKSMKRCSQETSKKSYSCKLKETSEQRRLYYS